MKLIRNIFKFIDKKIIIPITKFFVFIGKKTKISDKPLEKALSKKSGMIIISLILAFVIFFVIDRQNTTLLETNAEVIYNIPISATYNSEEYVVEGLPKSVDMTLIGTKANLYLAKQLPTQAIPVDLSDLKPGVHKVNLRYKKSISSVEYKIDPSVVTIVISNKQSETRDIKTDIVNIEKLDSKLAINNVKIDADEAIIKGTETSLAKVSTIKALINVKEIANPSAGTNTLKDIPLIAYDENGDKVDVELVPAKVNATIEIESPSKNVPIEVVTTGKVVFGKAIKEIITDVKQVTIYGDSATLDSTSSIKVTVDVDNLKGDKDYTINIKKPSGIRQISEKTVNVKVVLSDESTTEVSGVKLSYINLNSNYTAQITGENSTEITVILKGVDSVITGVNASEIEAYVDLDGLDVGEHEVEIKVKGKDSKISYTPKVTKTKIKIAAK